jgi:hypothetical protein
MSWPVVDRTANKIYVEFISSRVFTHYQSNISKNFGLTWAIVGFFTFLFLRSVVFTSRRFFKDKYPPGPPALPFFGNLFQLSMDAWVPFTKWKMAYGNNFPVNPDHVLKMEYFRPYRISERRWTAVNRPQQPQGRHGSPR